MPDGGLIGCKDARTLFDGDRSQAAAYTSKGSLKGWNGQIGRYLHGNSRLCLAVGTALAAPLLRLLDIEGGGFHLFSDSSDGKTTAANVGLSVWGEPEGLRVSWKGTSHGFDNIAAARNDGFLVLDEIGQANPYVVSETAYSIINGTGKIQGDKSGGNRAVLRWRVLILSTGEKTMESYTRTGGGDWQAGQAARLPSIPAGAGAGLGVFEMLHDFEQPAELAEHLNQVTAKHYGTLGQAWLNALINDKTAADKARKAIERFSRSLQIDSGQGRRVMMRFALVYAALSMAAAYGLLELTDADCKAAVTKCFTAWQEREGTGKYEDRRIIENAEEWLQFVPYSVRGVRLPSNGTELPKDFACFYQDLAQVLEVFIVPKVFETELCDGFDKAKVLEVLYQAGLAAKPKQTQKDKARWQFRKRFQGVNGRYYKLTLQLEDDDDDITES